MDYPRELCGGSDGQVKTELQIFCLDQQRVVAQGCLVPAGSGNQAATALTTTNVSAAQLTFFGDRIWMSHKHHLYCTGCIFRRFNRQQEALDDGVDVKSYPLIPNLPPLRIKQFHMVMMMNASQPKLKTYGNFLYLADGPLIKVFHSSQLDSLASDNWQPNHVFCAEGTVESIQADEAKIVCAISSEKKQRVEVFWHPHLDLSVGKKSALNHSVYIKNAEVFRNRYEMQCVTFRGSRLLVASSRILHAYPYYANHYMASARQSQLRVFSFVEGWVNEQI